MEEPEKGRERGGLGRKETGSKGTWLVARATVTEGHTCMEGDTEQRGTE